MTDSVSINNLSNHSHQENKVEGRIRREMGVRSEELVSRFKPTSSAGSNVVECSGDPEPPAGICSNSFFMSYLMKRSQDNPCACSRELHACFPHHSASLSSSAKVFFSPLVFFSPSCLSGFSIFTAALLGAFGIKKKQQI